MQAPAIKAGNRNLIDGMSQGFYILTRGLSALESMLRRKQGYDSCASHALDCIYNEAALGILGSLIGNNPNAPAAKERSKFPHVIQVRINYGALTGAR